MLKSSFSGVLIPHKNNMATAVQIATSFILVKSNFDSSHNNQIIKILIYLPERKAYFSCNNAAISMALIFGSSLLAPGAVKNKQNFNIYKQLLQVIDYPAVSETSVVCNYVFSKGYLAPPLISTRANSITFLRNSHYIDIIDQL